MTLYPLIMKKKTSSSLNFKTIFLRLLGTAHLKYTYKIKKQLTKIQVVFIERKPLE